MSAAGSSGSRRLRVLHCIYDDPRNPWVGGGGAERVRQLYGHLGGVVDATVLTGNYPGARDEVIDDIVYRRVGAPRPYPWSRWTYARAAARLLQTASFDAGVFDFSVYTPLWIPRDRPIGVTVHHLTGPTAMKRWGRILGRAISAVERSMLQRATWLSATSRATFDALGEIVSSNAQVELVEAGVPDELFRIERREQEYLLYFGRLDWFQKGLDTLLEAIGILVRERPSLELRIAGRGKDAERVRDWVRRRGLESNVRMLGEVTAAERLDLFSGAKLLLMPSRFEGFGMVAAEAMAAGVPIVATEAGSLPEVIAPPAGGVLVPVGEARALAHETGRLLEDSTARTNLSRSARELAERFRWHTVAERHLRFLQLIAASARAAPQPGLA